MHIYWNQNRAFTFSSYFNICLYILELYQASFQTMSMSTIFCFCIYLELKVAIIDIYLFSRGALKVFITQIIGQSGNTIIQTIGWCVLISLSSCLAYSDLLIFMNRRSAYTYELEPIKVVVSCVNMENMAHLHGNWFY